MYNNSFLEGLSLDLGFVERGINGQPKSHRFSALRCIWRGRDVGLVELKRSMQPPSPFLCPDHMGASI